MTSAEDMKVILQEAFMAGVKAAHPDAFLARADVRETIAQAAKSCTGRVLVLGAGKAAAAMAAALEREWPGELSGLVVTRGGYEVPTKNIEVAIGGHPYPKSQSAEIATRMLALASELGEGDLLIGLWSGGGSALLACPPEEVLFEAFRGLTKELLKSGADIHEINTVRKHLSQIAGGRLAQAASPAHLINLVIPDVVDEGNEAATLSAIASGPAVPDPTTLEQALAVLAKYECAMDPAINAHLSDLANETPKSWPAIHLAAQQTLTLSADAAVAAAAQVFQARGFALVPTLGNLTGDATEIATSQAELALSKVEAGVPTAIISGGELTVNVTGTGTGGPNQEFALAFAIALASAKGIYALSGDTDGIDGMGEAAGAFIAPDTLARLRAAGIDPQKALTNNDAGGAFAANGDLLITGPTFTNVNDLRLIVING